MRYCGNCLKGNPDDSKFCEACGKSLMEDVPNYHLMVGTMLNKKYVVGRSIGEGGFGITYIGKDSILDILVAIKEYFPNGYANRTNTISPQVTQSIDTERKVVFEKGLRRFLDEARSLAKFYGTAGIVDVRDFFEENGTAYIVMEYLDGQTLKEFLEYNGRLSEKDTVELLLPVMKALQKVHKVGLIHRDISPDNIMLMEGNIKLLDFGAVRDVSGSGNKSLTVTLKHGFAPEEQYREHGEQGPWTDVYALCATMYKCITGIIPDNALERMRKDEVKWPTELGIEIHGDFERVLMKGLNIFAQDRFSSIGELIDAIMETEPFCGKKESGNKRSSEGSKAQNDKDGTGGDKPPIIKIILPISIALAVIMVIWGIVITIGNMKDEPSDLTGEGANDITNPIVVVENNDDVASESVTNNEVTGVENTEEENKALLDADSDDKDLQESSFLTSEEKNQEENISDPSDNKDEVDVAKEEKRESRITDHSIHDLLLENTTVYKEDIADLLNCPELIALRFINCQFTEGCFDVLNGSNLYFYTLRFENCTGIDNYEWISGVYSAGELSNLTIKNCGLTDELFGQIKFNCDNPRSININISDNPELTDISGLSTCKNLFILIIDNDSVHDISFFKDVKKLYEFSANNNYLTSLDGLETAITLEKLSVAGNAITDVQGLQNCTKLKTVNLNDNYVTDIGFISNNKDSLESLYFNNNLVTSIKPLKNCKNLVYLSFSDNNVKELKHLKGFEKLEALNISGNQVESLDAISQCVNLRRLLASRNNITTCNLSSIFPKGESEKISLYIDLSYNKITSIENIPENFSGYFLGLALCGNTLEKYSALNGIRIGYLMVDYNKSLISKGTALNCEYIYILDCPLNKEAKIHEKYRKAEVVSEEEMDAKRLEVFDLDDPEQYSFSSWYGVKGERKELLG